MIFLNLKKNKIFLEKKKMFTWVTPPSWWSLIKKTKIQTGARWGPQTEVLHLIWPQFNHPKVFPKSPWIQVPCQEWNYLLAFHFCAAVKISQQKDGFCLWTQILFWKRCNTAKVVQKELLPQLHREYGLGSATGLWLVLQRLGKKHACAAESLWTVDLQLRHKWS